MAGKTIHREDVKALIRKRYGSLEEFQRIRGLGSQAVRDLLRGRSKAAHAAVAKEIGVEPEHLVISTGIVPKSGVVSTGRRARREKAVAA